MTDDTILSHAEALAEIKRLRARITELEAALAITTGKIAGLEAAVAIATGTLAKPTPDDDQPGIYTHDVPPNAPR